MNNPSITPCMSTFHAPKIAVAGTSSELEYFSSRTYTYPLGVRFASAFNSSVIGGDGIILDLAIGKSAKFVKQR